MLVAQGETKCGYWLESNPGSDCSGGRRRQIVGRQPGTTGCVQVVANALTGGELKLEVVLCPSEPARLDVARDSSAIPKIILTDEAAVVDLEEAAYQPKVNMPPGLRPVRGKSYVRRRVLGNVGT